jgi:iron(III) transport system substrate-binding protein
MGKEKGLEFMRRLAAQEPNFRKGHTLLTELLAAGEFPVVVAAYQHRVDEFISKSAPVQWVLTEPLIGSPRHHISLLAGAPRPDAGKLFIDFMLSAEGQQVLRERGRIVGRKGIDPSNPKVKHAKIFTLPVSAEKYDQLIKEFQQHFKTS